MASFLRGLVCSLEMDVTIPVDFYFTQDIQRFYTLKLISIDERATGS